MKKTVFRTYRYRECDDLAAFLEKMAAEGWRFKNWSFGLVFEKGDPAKETYCVEIFPKGKEMDSKAEEDAMEYAQYCQKAGWELVDGRRKMCIFRRRKEDAVPIVTPEEKLANVKEAETKLWRSSITSVGVLCGIQWLQLCFGESRILLLNQVMLFLFLILHLLILYRILQKIQDTLFWRKAEHLLENGEIPYYGMADRKQRIQRICGKSLYFLLYASMMGMAIVKGGSLVAGRLLFLLVLIGAFQIFLHTLRPSRSSYRAMQSMETMFLIFFIILVPFHTDAQEEEYFGMKSILGSMERWEDMYLESDGLVKGYEVYESPYPWVLDQIWKRTMKGQGQEVTEEWDAQYAVYRMGRYGVRYQDRMEIYETNSFLNQEQIERIKEWQDNNFKP